MMFRCPQVGRLLALPLSHRPCSGIHSQGYVQQTTRRNLSSVAEFGHAAIPNEFSKEILASDHFWRFKHGPPMVYHPNYSLKEWPPDHRFPMAKFRLAFESLVKDGTLCIDQVFEPITPGEDQPMDDYFLAVHKEDYYRSFCDGSLDPKAIRKIGFPWSPELVMRTKLEVIGTLLSSRLALHFGLACNIAGGTHHAFAEYGSGFTILNDLAITATNLIQTGLAKRVLIIDLDVHQGDGTSSIFADNDQVFTLNAHCPKNFPLKKQQSDLDIDIPEGSRDADYMDYVMDPIKATFASFQPDFVLYDAGIDPHETDYLGHLAMTNTGLEKRDRWVIEQCLTRGVPCATVIGGGYVKDPLELGLRHSIIQRAATAEWHAHGCYQRLLVDAVNASKP